MKSYTLQNQSNFLQLYPTGYQKKFDQIFAFGILKKKKGQDNYLVQVKMENQDPSLFTESFQNQLDLWIENNTHIYMFNGHFEMNLSRRLDSRSAEFYSTNVIDLYKKIQELRHFIPSKSLSLDSLSHIGKRQAGLFLGPQLYESYYPFHLKENLSQARQKIQNNLQAMVSVLDLYNRVKDSQTFYHEDFESQIQTFHLEGKQDLRIRGKNRPARPLFYHNPPISYEEDAEGNFTLNLLAIHTKYDQKQVCHAIAYPFIAKNPHKMPPGFLLLALDNVFFIDQIHQLIGDLRNHL